MIERYPPGVCDLRIFVKSLEMTGFLCDLSSHMIYKNSVNPRVKGFAGIELAGGYGDSIRSRRDRRRPPESTAPRLTRLRLRATILTRACSPCDPSRCVPATVDPVDSCSPATLIALDPSSHPPRTPSSWNRTSVRTFPPDVVFTVPNASSNEPGV